MFQRVNIPRRHDKLDIDRNIAFQPQREGVENVYLPFTLWNWRGGSAVNNAVGRNPGDLLCGGKRIQNKAQRALAQHHRVEFKDHPAALRRYPQGDHRRIAGGGACVGRTQRIIEPIEQCLAEKQILLGMILRQGGTDLQRQPCEILVDILRQQATVKRDPVIVNQMRAFGPVGQHQHQRAGIKLDGIRHARRYSLNKTVQPGIKADGIVEQGFLNQLGAGRVQQNNKLDTLSRIPGGVIALSAQGTVILNRDVKPQAAW
ncbi:hypothetical protein D3C81_621010 [compost metagenome]